MPLGFDSRSHGTLAFGFFHIETDMLLLQQLFFFASDFCAALVELARADAGRPHAGTLPGFVIDQARRVGDLRGALAGSAPHGFIGELYRLRPFPGPGPGFRQKTRGEASRLEVEEVIGRFGRATELPLRADPAEGIFALDEYLFDRQGLLELTEYVWRGGMPGWQDGRRPEYLMQTARELRQSGSPWFQGLPWDPARVGVPDGVVRV